MRPEGATAGAAAVASLGPGVSGTSPTHLGLFGFRGGGPHVLSWSLTTSQSFGKPKCSMGADVCCEPTSCINLVSTSRNDGCADVCRIPGL